MVLRVGVVDGTMCYSGCLWFFGTGDHSR